ncbi:MAG TPA: lysylphosphatidylglycerol synthase transmembrane domain-containing protein [Vicinamibacterales bacterium]|nr:lysylphosphatidylglycerol synthase transmembrane domain-containing protein [Vicinamibacterales bacterium]
MGRGVRLVLGLGLTAAALWLADPAAVVRAAAGADPRWLGLAVLLLLPDRALMAWRWLLLLRAFDRARRVPLAAVLRVFFVSTFAGTFLPSVGGDAVRAIALSRHAVGLAESAATVLMDRLLGIWALLLLGAAGLLASPLGRGDPGVIASLGLCAAGCAGVGSFLASERAAAVCRRAVRLLPAAAVRTPIERLLDATRRYRRHPRLLALGTAGSIAAQLLRVLQAYCLGRSLGLEAGFAVYAVLVPVALLVLLVPITIYGLGTGQLAFVWLFGRAGVPSAEAFALSVLVIGLGALGNLPGGLLYAFAKPAREPRAPRAPLV